MAHTHFTNIFESTQCQQGASSPRAMAWMDSNLTAIISHKKKHQQNLSPHGEEYNENIQLDLPKSILKYGEVPWSQFNWVLWCFMYLYVAEMNANYQDSLWQSRATASFRKANQQVASAIERHPRFFEIDVALDDGW